MEQDVFMNGDEGLCKGRDEKEECQYSQEEGYEMLNL